MAESSLYLGEADGGRVFRAGRIGFDSGNLDVSTENYECVYKTERIFPAGPGGLVNFRRILIHILALGEYSFSVKVWVDEERTKIADGTNQIVTFSREVGELSEITEEMEIEAEGSGIVVEITADSEDISGTFLIEGIAARVRVVREGSTRTGSAE